MSALMNNNEYGHTLMELVVVLLIFSICLGIPTLSYVQQDEGREMEAFVSEFEQDLHYAQQQAMGKTVNARLDIQNATGSYQVVVDGETMKRVPFPKHVYFQGVSMSPETIRFRPSGNTDDSGEIAIRSSDQFYRAMFLVGSGRFYVEKVEKNS
ncbi:prepilin-type N-terminal cleavage/methylation domain-containing protein [Salicibibacter cibi]|uniref:Prepilin-type N-terminal cleavage/methylation domain-containing protein n=1 Tax=Salicibibacter cibi TaxID=2743001 RepID=A0A7T7CF54_9BACI|nr:competence type IV pilus minor pilin ComGD [Salicibibacter cibi]QQK79743.1 prepilin-type N-terminal cleavage/methylation domain-containing protein [Salicibibacter cibi]